MPNEKLSSSLREWALPMGTHTCTTHSLLSKRLDWELPQHSLALVECLPRPFSVPNIIQYGPSSKEAGIWHWGEHHKV